MAIGVVGPNPVAVEAAEDRHKIRVARVPDTWESAATNDSIYFDIGSASIDDAAAEVILRHAIRLRVERGAYVTLIAHADDLGGSSLELAKGQARLEAVLKRLDELKVTSGRIRKENHGGESRTAPPCADEECRRKRRRVDFLFHR